MIGLTEPTASVVDVGTPDVIAQNNLLAADLLRQYDEATDRSRIVGAAVAMAMLGKASISDLEKFFR